MLQNSSEFNNLGAGGFGGGGFGFGGSGMGTFGLFGLLGIDSLTGRRHKGGDDDGCRNEIATLAAITNAKDDARANTLGLAAAITNAKDTTILEGRALGAAICESEKTNLQQFYALAIQNSNNTQAIKDQATSFAIVADKRFDDLASAGVLQTASILARINQAEVDSLRDQLHGERRRVDARELEINITNSNTSLQNQIQAQGQAQLQAQAQARHDNDRKFDVLFSQIAKSGQDIINVGGLLAGVSQTANPTNIKS